MFVDEDFNAYGDQWELLSKIRKLSEVELDMLLRLHIVPTLGELSKTSDSNAKFSLEAIYTDKETNAKRLGRPKYLSPSQFNPKYNQWQLFTTVIDTTDAKFGISKDESGNMHILAMNDEAALAMQIAYESSIEFNDLPHGSFEDDFSRVLDFYSKHILSEGTKSFIRFQLERVCRYWKQDNSVIYKISYLQ